LLIGRKTLFICVCNAVTDKDIKKACTEGARTIGCLKQRLNVATCCGQCHQAAVQLLPKENYTELTASKR